MHDLIFTNTYLIKELIEVKVCFLWFDNKVKVEDNNKCWIIYIYLSALHAYGLNSVAFVKFENPRMLSSPRNIFPLLY